MAAGLIGPIDKDTVPRRRKGVYGEEMDGESVLYDARNATLHLLNSSASAVWWLIDGVSSVEQLAGELASRFDAAPEIMRSDVVKLLEVLGEQQLVETVRTRAPRASHG
jgi:Coenzyme PQQ synthesis protein D (PqqD)